MGFSDMNEQTMVVGPYTLTNIHTSNNGIQQAICKWPRPGEITAAYVSVVTAITGNTGNAKYIKLVNLTNTSAITNVAVRACIDNVNIAALTPTALTETEYTFAKNDVLGINISGLNTAGGVDQLFVALSYVYGSPAGAS